MNRIALAGACLVLCAVQARAQYVDGLPAAASVSSGDLLPVIQGSTPVVGGGFLPGSGVARRATVGQIAGAVGNTYVPYTGASSPVNLGAFPLTLGVSSAPTAPGSGGALYVDSAGVLHYLNASADTSLVVGTGIGDILGPLQNFQGSGHPVLKLSDRLVLMRQNTSATDFADVQITRRTSYTGGGPGNINSALEVDGTYGANDGASNWTVLNKATTSGTAGGTVAATYSQVNRTAGSTQPVWGLVADTRDETGVSSSGSGGGAPVSIETDLRADLADDAGNGATYGGVGVRKAISVVFSRFNTAGTTPSEFSNLLWFHQSTPSDGTELYAYADSVIGFGVNTQIRSALDTRGAIPPTGVSNPVASVVMSAGQVVDFDGGASLTSGPGRTLSYVAADTALEYRSGTTPLIKIADSGALILAQSTVAALPTCNAALKGGMMGVTDATTPTYNGALTGGGTVAIPVYCNGTAWTAH